MWKLIAWFVTRPRVRSWLMSRAVRTPYNHIVRTKGEVYMRRYWLFNPYDDNRKARFRWLPSVRIHHIQLEDEGPEHNHPWRARSIILQGWYAERRGTKIYFRDVGKTFKILPNDYHRIISLSHGGCSTLFITWGYSQNWGFKNDAPV